jgi:hypothetical protein
MPLSSSLLAPAQLRRALFTWAVVVPAMLFAGRPPARPPELAQIGKPDEAEAAQILERFRQSGVPFDHYLQFQLRTMPRRGPEHFFEGRYWGSRNEQGAITRIELVDAEGGTQRLLIQNGEQAAVWRYSGGRVARLEIAQLFEPVLPGVEVTAFDLQMPFLYWPDATLERISRGFRGRPAHAFVFRAPPEFLVAQRDIAAARVYLDTQYNVLMQYELLDGRGKPQKTFSILSLKTIDGQPVPKTIDFRNEVTRDKTRLLITGAALHLDFQPQLFEPARLAEDIRPPDRIVRVDP